MQSSKMMSEMSKTINMSTISSNMGSPKVTNRSVFIAKMRDKLKLKSSLHQSIAIPLSSDRIFSAPARDQVKSVLASQVAKAAVINPTIVRYSQKQG